jgi:hypothetical protein
MSINRKKRQKDKNPLKNLNYRCSAENKNKSEKIIAISSKEGMEVVA